MIGLNDKLWWVIQLITLKEIAAEAGVSVMTVSNVINNNTTRVSPETADRIKAIIEKYHYVPNMAARTLISKASHIIALLLPLWYSTADSMLLDPYVGQVVGMLETQLREKGYYVMICSFKTVDQVLSIQRTWQIDGSVLIMPHEDKITRELVSQSVSPLVVIDRRFEDLPMNSVTVDDHKGGYLSARHLLEKGHRNIGFAGPTIKSSSVIRDRYMGYQDALAEYGLEPNPEWVFTDCFHQEGGEQVGSEIAKMRHRPTAMLATEDLIACGIVRACKANGMAVPKDISVIGFDDTLPSRLISPALTTIAQDVRYKASCVMDILMRIIQNPGLRGCHTMLDVKLVERESVATL